MIGPGVSNPGPGTIQKINDELTLEMENTW